MHIQFTTGADPEVFVGDALSARSIIGKIGGTKDMPLALPLGDGFAVQEDNVALEFNVPPAGSRDEFIKNICAATGFLESVMRDKYNLEFLKDSAISFPEEELKDPKAFVFGCDPDYNAWTRKRNEKPKAEDKTLRSCGGHVHIGYDSSLLDSNSVIKACDLFLGVPSVLMDKGIRRKELYGKAGAFRKKPFGVEYRVLSNFWIFEPKLMGWVHDNVSRALDAVSNNFDFDSEQENIVSAINNNDVELATMLINKYELQIV